MSLHRSLKTKPSGLNQHRNVLTRAERIAKMTDEGTFDLSDDTPIGLVKYGSRKLKAVPKKKDEDEDGESTESTETASEA